ncbi:MAG: hypothetical protein ACP5M9_01525 [Candidatus Micrarchaeia archaeon]
MLGIRREDPNRERINRNLTLITAMLEIEKALSSRNFAVAGRIFNCSVGDIEKVEDKPILTGRFAEFAEKLGYKIKAAQLYEKAGTDYGPKSISFLNKALNLFNESGELTDSERVQKKIKFQMGSLRRN